MKDIEQYTKYEFESHGYMDYFDPYLYETIKGNFTYDLLEYPVKYISSNDDEELIHLYKGQYFNTHTNKNKIVFKYEYEV